MSQYSVEAREIELEAIARLTKYYSKDFIIKDLCESESYDFEIHHFENGLVGIGEISWLEDPVRKSAWTALLKQDRHHIIPLKAGQGFWSMSLKNTANISVVTRQLPFIIEKMISENQTERQIYETWPLDVISIDLRELGIEFLRKVDSYKSVRDECFFLLEGSGGVIPDSLEPLAKHLEGLIDTKFKDCVDKLSSIVGVEKHLYFKMGSYLPFNLVDPLGFHNPEVSIRNFCFPEGITHVWLIASNENFRSVLWENKSTYLV